MITLSKIILTNVKRFSGRHEFKFTDKNVFTIIRSLSWEELEEEIMYY